MASISCGGASSFRLGDDSSASLFASFAWEFRFLHETKFVCYMKKVNKNKTCSLLDFFSQHIPNLPVTLWSQGLLQPGGSFLSFQLQPKINSLLFFSILTRIVICKSPKPIHIIAFFTWVCQFFIIAFIIPKNYTLCIVYLCVSKIDKVQYRLQFWPFEPSQEDQGVFMHISH